ncbi:3-oxoacyl-ACP reductase [Streptomyces abyssalis]|uniref:3-oxoacyl-ACP reductase n=1 Tax=Streptomyces abyssalis TaxID=933944 RepID=A0A1E7JPD3_9ACTN|nr:SDR family oxidoreductase [Streptomyces abyssalis]OEU90142.1 3-oxoacyl-ACP reductase [Streptomyces abyssalis]OEU94875.1 3-oxoacyl-ACP reductase [Streptomyces abyssalis]
MLLENKTAVVYGGAGTIGSAVARVFAREGAALHLAGRTRAPLDELAGTIARSGGRADVAALDATDRAAVERHAEAVAQHSGGIDVAFNATSNEDLHGTDLVDMADEDVLRPVTKAVTTHLTLATAVARHMIPRRTGVILAMGGGREAIPRLGGSHIAWSALAGLCRQLAAELGPHGIRSAWLLSPGSPGPTTPPEDDPEATGTLLHRRPRLDEVAYAAAFLASDRAATMTATELNVTGGAVID